MSAAGDETPEVVGQVTLSCPECGDEFAGPEKGPGSAPLRLGAHRRLKHNVAGSGKNSAGAKAKPEREATPLGVVTDLGSRFKGSGAPKDHELAGVFGELLSAVTVLLARSAVSRSPMMAEQPPQSADDAIDRLSLTPSQGAQVSAPFTSMLAGSQLNKKFGRKVVEHSNVIPAAMVLIELGSGYAEFARETRQWQARQEQMQRFPAPTYPQNVADVGTPAPASGAPPAGPVPTSGASSAGGHVVSAEEVQRITQARQSNLGAQ